jgi:hypothetical protein
VNGALSTIFAGVERRDTEFPSFSTPLLARRRGDHVLESERSFASSRSRAFTVSPRRRRIGLFLLRVAEREEPEFQACPRHDCEAYTLPSCPTFVNSRRPNHDSPATLLDRLARRLIGDAPE